jgi:SAM-dependent methyltransferase
VLARAATSLRLRALDLSDKARGRADRLVPPRRLRGFTGDSDFLATGTELQRLLREHGGLEPASRVLDVGCGIGRVARTLAGVLDPGAGGGYVGFDPVQEAIVWCAERYPAHFRFVHADLRNDLYNRGGAIAATEYRFPVDSGWATLAVATSVFTHLDADETGHYLAEVRRALAPGGVALLTFFLLDDGSRAAIEAGNARQVFGGADAVAHDRAAVLDSIAAPATVHEGTWRGGQGLSYQDLIVVRAPG